MSIRALLLATVAAATLASPALAQTAPAELEGSLTSIGSDTITVFKTTVALKTDTAFSTPTKEGLDITTVMRCNGQRYPGRTQDNNTLVGGTAIVVGTSDTATGTRADSVFFEPSENVLLGRVSKLPDYQKDKDGNLIKGPNGLPIYESGTLELEGTPVVILGTSATTHYPPMSTTAFNECIPGKGVRNDFGFSLPPEALDVGSEVAAEGWYGDSDNDGINDTFYAFLVDGVGTVTDQPTGVTISRAQCRDRGGARGMEWEIRGGTADKASRGAGTVTIGRMVLDSKGKPMFKPYMTVVANRTTNVTVTSVADPLNVPYGAYTFKGNILNGNGNGTCPSNVAVQYLNAAPATFGVDVR